MELLSIPAIRALTISGFALTFLSLAFDVVFTLFCYTPIDAGGLGLEVSVDTKSHEAGTGPDIFLVTLGLPTARDDRERARTRRNARRPPPVLRHALHPAAVRLRQNVQRMHVRLAHRVWPPSAPQRPRPRHAAHRRVNVRTRLDRPPRSPRPLQDWGYPTQPEYASY